MKQENEIRQLEEEIKAFFTSPEVEAAAAAKDRTILSSQRYLDLQHRAEACSSWSTRWSFKRGWPNAVKRVRMRAQNTHVQEKYGLEAGYIYAQDVKKEYLISTRELAKLDKRQYSDALEALGVAEYCPFDYDGSDWDAHRRELAQGAKCICQVDERPMQLLRIRLVGGKTSYQRKSIEEVLK